MRYESSPTAYLMLELIIQRKRLKVGIARTRRGHHRVHRVLGDERAREFTVTVVHCGDFVEVLVTGLLVLEAGLLDLNGNRIACGAVKCLQMAVVGQSSASSFSVFKRSAGSSGPTGSCAYELVLHFTSMPNERLQDGDGEWRREGDQKKKKNARKSFATAGGGSDRNFGLGGVPRRLLFVLVVAGIAFKKLYDRIYAKPYERDDLRTSAAVLLHKKLKQKGQYTHMQSTAAITLPIDRHYQWQLHSCHPLPQQGM